MIGAQQEDVKNLHFFCKWPSVEDGGLLALERWLEQHPRCRAVFIDTFARVRKAAKNDYSYYDDYDAISALKDIADRFHVGIVVVHHLRKQKADDPFDAISGTTGLSGSADTNIVIMRDRNKTEGIMYITGRDVQEQELALSYTDGIWKIMGEATHVHATKVQQDLLCLLHEVGEPMTPTQIAQETGRSVGGLSKTLRRMVNEGLIEKIAEKGQRGSYIPKPQKERNSKLQGKWTEPLTKG